MAENKKSFVLYADLIHTVRKMPKAKIADLFLTILAYVNDENPVVKDVTVDLVFEPIKRQMKRDLKKYESVKGTKSSSGIMGNLKRWNLDLYDKVVKQEMTLDEAAIIAKDRTTSQTVADGRKASQSIANVAVTVTDTVTVTDNDNVTHKGNLRDVFFNDLPNSQDFEIIARDLKLTKEVLKTCIPKFIEFAEPSYPNFQRFTAHFKNWVKLNKPKDPNQPKMVY